MFPWLTRKARLPMAVRERLASGAHGAVSSGTVSFFAVWLDDVLYNISGLIPILAQGL